MPDTEQVENATMHVKRGPGRPPSTPQIKEQDRPAEAKKPNWVTNEEAAKYELMLGKRFVRREELCKGDKDKFFYQIESLSPYSNAGQLGNTLQYLVMFLVNKYNRNKFVQKKVFDGKNIAGRDIKTEEQVRRYSIDKETGNAEEHDPDASFQIDSRLFEELFVPDR